MKKLEVTFPDTNTSPIGETRKFEVHYVITGCNPDAVAYLDDPSNEFVKYRSMMYCASCEFIEAVNKEDAYNKFMEKTREVGVEVRVTQINLDAEELQEGDFDATLTDSKEYIHYFLTHPKLADEFDLKQVTRHLAIYCQELEQEIEQLKRKNIAFAKLVNDWANE